MYKIERVYFNRPGVKRLIETALTLEQAQAHCNNPEASSSTATGKTERARTRRLGPWFDIYTECSR